MDGSSKLPGSVAQQAAAAATTTTVNTTNTQLQIQMHKYKHHKHTNTQVQKYALDSIVTHICSLLIFSIYRQSSSARSYIASKAWHQIPQAVSQCPTPRLISIQVQTRCQITTTDYAGICLPGDSVETDRLVSGRLWASILRQFHIFVWGIKFIVIEKCLWRTWALKSTPSESHVALYRSRLICDIDPALLIDISRENVWSVALVHFCFNFQLIKINFQNTIINSMSNWTKCQFVRKYISMGSHRWNTLNGVADQVLIYK